MSKINDGGPAFPHPNPDYAQDYGLHRPFGGMSLRDWFAGQALLRVYSEGGRYGDSGLKQVAEYSYAMADAMLAAREASS